MQSLWNQVFVFGSGRSTGLICRLFALICDFRRAIATKKHTMRQCLLLVSLAVASGFHCAPRLARTHARQSFTHTVPALCTQATRHPHCAPSMRRVLLSHRLHRSRSFRHSAACWSIRRCGSARGRQLVRLPSS